MPVLWTFRCYVADDGIDQIRAAYNRAGRQARNKCLSRLKMLAQIEFEQWKNGVLYKDLQDSNGLGEIRFKADNVQQRIFGFKSDDFEFTMLIWATKKGRKSEPSDPIERAGNRKNEVIADENRTIDLWLPLE